MLKVLENITEIMLSRILAEFFWRWVHFRRIRRIFGGYEKFSADTKNFLRIRRIFGGYEECSAAWDLIAGNCSFSIRYFYTFSHFLHQYLDFGCCELIAQSSYLERRYLSPGTPLTLRSIQQSV